MCKVDDLDLFIARYVDIEIKSNLTRIEKGARGEINMNCENDPFLWHFA